MFSSYAFAQEGKKPQTIGIGSLSGRIIPNDQNRESIQSGATIIAFFNKASGPPPSPGRRHRVPDQITRLGSDLLFKTSLLEGEYYIGVISRKSPRAIGPPQEGDFSFVAFDNENKPKVFLVKAGENTDTGPLEGKVLREIKEVKSDVEYFTIEGFIKDGLGAPLKEAVIIAFKVGESRRRPEYVLRNSSEEGHYSIKLATRNSYFITVRTGIGGGQPSPGEYIGRYGGNNPITVSGNKDEILKDININVFKIPEPGASKDKFNNRPGVAPRPQGP